MHELYLRIGEQIRLLREEAGLTQAELADAISLSRTSVTNIEKGRQKIQVHTIYEIAALLDKDVSAILPDVGDRSSVGEKIPDDIGEKDRYWIQDGIQDFLSQSGTKGR